jgi:hypothetical protein
MAMVPIDKAGNKHLQKENKEDGVRGHRSGDYWTLINSLTDWVVTSKVKQLNLFVCC